MLVDARDAFFKLLISIQMGESSRFMLIVKRPLILQLRKPFYHSGTKYSSELLELIGLSASRVRIYGVESYCQVLADTA